MAGDEGAEGSRGRRRTDLNIFLGLPPLPRPPGRLDAAPDCTSWLLPSSSAGPVPDALRTEDPVESLAPSVTAYSPSNALSAPEEQTMLDPIVYAWLDGYSIDGEEGADAAEPVLGSPVTGPIVYAATGGLDVDDLEPREMFVHTGGVAARVEMVSTSTLSHSAEGPVEIEARAPELRLQRLIQISQRYNIVRSGSADRSQRATSPEAVGLSSAIQHSHRILESARQKKLNDANVGVGGGGVKKDVCGCNSGFECRICLDPAKEPVLTPCGHLFCWPCLYQWLHAHSDHSECPVCKGEVLEVNVTPIYGGGGEERDSSTSLSVPPRPHANRMEGLRQQLQLHLADHRSIASVVRQLIQNQGNVSVSPGGQARPRNRRQQRQHNNAPPLIHATAHNMDTVAQLSGNQVPLPPSSVDNMAPAVPAPPQQSSSVEQPATSSTAAVVLGEPESSRRSRPSELPTTRRTRRRRQELP